MTNSPKKPLNFTVEELLKKVQPPVNMEALEFGGMFNVRLNYICNVDLADGCHPTVIVQRLDAKSNIGFATKYAHYFYTEEEGKGSVHSRDQFTAYGLRFILSSKGKGKKFDVKVIILQVSVALALLGMADLVCDAVMKNLLAERRHFREYKEEVTPDFSDLRDRMNELQAASKNARQKTKSYK